MHYQYIPQIYLLLYIKTDSGKSLHYFKPASQINEEIVNSYIERPNYSVKTSRNFKQVLNLFGFTKKLGTRIRVEKLSCQEAYLE